MKIFLTIAICAVLFSIVSCKNEINYGDIQKTTADQAQLKINYESAYTANPAIVLEINGQRVSTAITFRTPFPGGGYNTNGLNNSALLQLGSGATQVSVVRPHKIDNGTDSLVLYSTTFQAVAGKTYTMHITDTATTTQNILMEENLTLPDSSVSRYRFVNLMPNVAAVDLYYGATTITAADQSTDSLVVGGMSYLQSSPEFTMKAGILKTWKIRPAGAAKTAATVLAGYSSASAVQNRRVYTAFACGYSGKTTTAQKPYISFLLVR